MTTILMPIFDGVTHLDFTGPHQVFVNLPDAEVIVASRGARPVRSHGLEFSALADLDAMERCDVLCVPGGLGVAQALEDEAFMTRIAGLADTATYLTSVCTGSLILAATGRLEGRRAACHWAFRELLADFGAIPDPARVVRDGNIITGGGVTAGIDFAFTLAAELRGPELAQAIQLGIEYAPAPPFDSGRPDLAPPEILRMVEARSADAYAASHARIRKAAARVRQAASN